MAGEKITFSAEEAKSALSHLFTINHEAFRNFETGEYFTLYAKGAKRIQAILGIEREVLVLGNLYADQQPRSVQFAKKIIADSEGRLESTFCIVIHRDAKGNVKLKRWGRENGLAVLPIYTANGILPRGQELERLLSYEFFTQDPFDITGPVANDAQFFGRRSEAQELARKLQFGQIRACFGIRKIGKTSVLHRVLSEIKDSYTAVTVFVDCQRDDVFSLDASALLYSISQTLRSLKVSGMGYAEVDAVKYGGTTADATRSLQDALAAFDCPIILSFDEVDYITPGNLSAPQWRLGFVEFWRNVRAAYHAAAREERVLSIVVSGVSSRWFSVESIDGVENAALAFVPEEYLSPLPRGAANAMIKNVGAMAGLQFDEGALNAISSYCSDMPFWIRKACSSIHAKIETSKRPIRLSSETVIPLLEEYTRDEGGALAKVALQHLFRVYPELKEPALRLRLNEKIQPHALRVLCRYGIANEKDISGSMMRMALQMIAEDCDEETPTSAPLLVPARGAISDWAEELSGISYRRNILERSLRSLVINFLRVHALSVKDAGSAKELLLRAIPSSRRAGLEPFHLEAIAEKLYWADLSPVISKNWSVFEKVFGDKSQFQANAEIVNDRPDAHAKALEATDIALHRRALQWFEDRLARI